MLLDGDGQGEPSRPPQEDVDGEGAGDELDDDAEVGGAVLEFEDGGEEVELLDFDGLGEADVSPGTPGPALISCFVGSGSAGLPAR